ncbi:MAG: glycosyltransferase family 4 protein, partial [Candidatus Sericytochromatia bacterium]|nr:glycosyltransferase family 4 protein [Candidatus Sericytochromatia bacterium]
MAKRVLLLSEFYPPVPGGAELAAQRLARCLLQLGLQPHVLTTDTSAGPPGWATVTEPDGLTVTRVRPDVPRPSPELMAKALASCGPADLVMAFYLRSYAAVAVRQAARWGVPSLICARGRDALFDLNDWETMPPIASAVRAATCVTAVTQEIRQLLQPYRDEPDVLYWPNTVDLDRFRPMPQDAASRVRQGLPAIGLLIGFFGNLRPSKGLEQLLGAFVRVQQQRPDAHLVIIGGLGPDEQRTLDDWLAAQPDVRTAVHVLPFVPQTALPPLLGCLDQAWYPALFDGFSNSLLQGIACEVPAIVTPVGGNADVISDGRNGLVIPAGDVTALTEAALRLAADPTWARQLAGRGGGGLPAGHHPEGTERRARR